MPKNFICKQQGLPEVILGLEPTSHCFKPLAHYLTRHGIKVVLINPYHTKRTKELDDNSPTKNDKKDALTIARLIRDGRFYQLYLPQDVFAELKSLVYYQGQSHEIPECDKKYHKSRLR